MAEHTAEYYQHLLAVAEKELASYRDVVRYQVGVNGYSTEVQILRAEIDRWKRIACHALDISIKTGDDAYLYEQPHCEMCSDLFEIYEANR